MTSCSHLIHVKAYWQVKIYFDYVGFSPFFNRNMQDECMKSCVWEQQTWVMKKKPESTVWRWRRGYLDHTGWGFNNHSLRELYFTWRCEEGQKVYAEWHSEYKISTCIRINLNVNLSVLLSNANPVCSLPPFASLTFTAIHCRRKIARVTYTWSAYRSVLSLFIMLSF